VFWRKPTPNFNTFNWVYCNLIYLDTVASLAQAFGYPFPYSKTPPTAAKSHKYSL